MRFAFVFIISQECYDLDKNLGVRSADFSLVEMESHTQLARFMVHFDSRDHL